MKIAALALLALGASAYVVPDTKAVVDNAVEARMPVRSDSTIDLSLDLQYPRQVAQSKLRT